MSKTNLTDVASLTNEQSALSTINLNSATIEAASDDFLSRSGASPNQMLASLDMNSNRILNLPKPISDSEPARLIDVTDASQSHVMTIGESDIYLGTNGDLLYNNNGKLGNETLASLLVSPPAIGGTTPSAIHATTLSTTGTSTFGYTGASYPAYFFSNNGGQYPVVNKGLAIGGNFTGGGAEVDFINTTQGYSNAFSWYQQTGASSLYKLADLSDVGVLTVYGGLNINIPNSTVNGGIPAPTIGLITEGSAASPVTTVNPAIYISKYEAITGDAEGAQNSPIIIQVNSHNDSSGGVSSTSSKYGLVAQSNGFLSIANQYGSGDSVGTWSQATQNAPHAYRMFYTADQMSPGGGGLYEIASVGTTNFTLYGAASNTVGTIFTNTGAGIGTGTIYSAPVAATALVNGGKYQILTAGTTNFTLVGSPNSTVGTQFVATGPGTGTGTAFQVFGYTAWAAFNYAVAASGSLGNVVGTETGVVNNTGFDHTWSGSQAAQVLALGGYLSVGVDSVAGGTNLCSSGYMLRNGGNLFDVGLGASPGSVKSTFLQDDSSSTTVLRATGTHTTGIDLSGATLTTAYKSTGASIDGSGNGIFASVVIGSNFAKIDSSQTLFFGGISTVARNSSTGAVTLATNASDIVLNPNGVTTTAKQIVSTLATGTAPFSVASTTLVSNLHAATADAAPVSGLTGLGTGVATALASTMLANPVGVVTIHKSNVDLNTLGDNAIAMPALPTGFTKWQVWQLINTNSGSVASLTTAQYGLFTAASGGGVALVASGTALSGLTSNTTNTTGTMNVQTTNQTIYIDSTITNIYYRVTQVQSAGAAVNVTLMLRPLP